MVCGVGGEGVGMGGGACFSIVKIRLYRIYKFSTLITIKLKSRGGFLKR